MKAHRIFSLFLSLSLCLCLGISESFAQPVSPSRQTLQTSIQRILNLIKQPEYVNPATRAPLRQQIEDEVYHIFDFKEFSARTVGQKWRSLTPDQQKRFSDAFASLLFSTYLNKIDGYNGEEVTFLGERSNNDGTRVEQATVLTMKSGKKIPVNYRMLPKNGTWCVYDVLVEGISLVKNYRTQFQDILTSSNPEELITRIKAKSLEEEKKHGVQ